MRLIRQSILNAVVAAIAAALLSACASSETKRSTGEFTDDAALTAKVKSAIATDVGARTAGAINIETYRGVVQLTGFVSAPEQAQRAEAAAKKVEGVRSVKNDVRIKPSS
ncbi:MAG TPA: BON domain-containing protein [Burkholderiales bacterium]|jgi:hyperosmotically inducible protein|nr:BON domain-containing protein [Burkholderiales bacterium]